MIQSMNNSPSFNGYIKIVNAPKEGLSMFGPAKGVAQVSSKTVDGVTEFAYKTAHAIDEKTFDEGVVQTLKSFIITMNKIIGDASGKQKPIELFYSLDNPKNLEKIV